MVYCGGVTGGTVGAAKDGSCATTAGTSVETAGSPKLGASKDDFCTNTAGSFVETAGFPKLGALKDGSSASTAGSSVETAVFSTAVSSAVDTDGPRSETVSFAATGNLPAETDTYEPAETEPSVSEPAEVTESWSQGTCPSLSSLSVKEIRENDGKSSIFGDKAGNKKREESNISNNGKVVLKKANAVIEDENDSMKGVLEQTKGGIEDKDLSEVVLRQLRRRRALAGVIEQGRRFEQALRHLREVEVEGKVEVEVEGKVEEEGRSVEVEGRRMKEMEEVETRIEMEGKEGREMEVDGEEDKDGEQQQRPRIPEDDSTAQYHDSVSRCCRTFALGGPWLGP